MRKIILASTVAMLPIWTAPALAQGMTCDGRLLVGQVQMQLSHSSGDAERGPAREPMNQFTVQLRNMSAQTIGVLVAMRLAGGTPLGGIGMGSLREAEISPGGSVTMTLFRQPVSQTPPATSTVQNALNIMCR